MQDGKLGVTLVDDDGNVRDICKLADLMRELT